MCNKKVMRIKSPRMEIRGTLSFDTIVKNLFYDAVVYEDAQCSYKSWCYLLTREPELEENMCLFKAVRSNSIRLCKLLGKHKYKEIIEAVRQQQGWNNVRL